MTKLNRPENYMFRMSWLKQQQQHQQQIQKFYVLQYICQKFVQKKTQTYYYKKRIKERDASANSSKYIPPKYICKLVSNSYKKTNWGESWLYIYQNYKGYQFELDAKTTEANKELSEEEILMYSMFIDDNLYKKNS